MALSLTSFAGSSPGQPGRGQPEAGLDDRDVGEHVLRPARVVEAAPVARRSRPKPRASDPPVLVQRNPGQDLAPRRFGPAQALATAAGQRGALRGGTRVEK